MFDRARMYKVSQGWVKTLVERLKSETGVALPAATTMLFIISSIGVAIASGATAASSQSSRDGSVKRAVAAADAGMETALYRLNKMEPDPLQCVAVGTGGLQFESVHSDGWCREQNEQLDQGAGYSYRVSAGTQVTVNRQTLVQRKIVATGLVNGVKRRAMTVVAYVNPPTVFGGYAVVGLDGFFAENNGRVQGNAASNSVMRLKNNAEICGDAIPGPGRVVELQDNARVCPGYSTTPPTEPLVIAPVEQGNAPTVNDNGRIGSLDPWTTRGSSSFDPRTRVLTVKGNATLTLTGNVYSFCYISLENNAQLMIGSRNTTTPLKIYIDAPENCPNVSGAGSMLQNNATITNANAEPSALELYFVGSSRISTTVEFKNNSSNSMNMIVYAPKSTVTLQNNATVLGAITGKTVSLKNNARVLSDQSLTGVQGELEQVHQRQRWVECVPEQRGTAPDSGC